MALSRRSLLAAMVLAPLAAPGPAWAAGGGAPEFYAKLPQIAIEYWDTQGLFHMVNVDLTVVFPAQTAAINKKVGDKIGAALSAMAWEDFAKGNPAATIKAVAMDVLRQDPATEKATDVLVIKLVLR